MGAGSASPRLIAQNSPNCETDAFPQKLVEKTAVRDAPNEPSTKFSG